MERAVRIYAFSHVHKSMVALQFLLENYCSIFFFIICWLIVGTQHKIHVFNGSDWKSSFSLIAAMIKRILMLSMVSTVTQSKVSIEEVLVPTFFVRSQRDEHRMSLSYRNMGSCQRSFLPCYQQSPTLMPVHVWTRTEKTFRQSAHLADKRLEVT